MEVRCGKCNKLFRVSDDKISGEGIKFTCTRCGEYVKITKQEFEHYTLSKTAVSALDMFEPKPAAEPKPVASPAPEVRQKPEPPHAPEAGQTVLTPEPKAAPVDPLIAKPEPVQQAAPVMPIVAKPEPKPTPVHQPKPELAPVIAAAETVQASTPALSAPAAPAGSPSERIVSATPAAASRSGRMVAVLIVSLLILGGVGYVGFTYFKPAAKQAQVVAPELASIEGLRISNPAGAIDPLGDLLINGVVENTTDKEKNAWLVVAEVYDAQGVVLNKIRLLNGKQLFTRGDYEILAQRGVNVQELKTRSLQEQGVVIPPKGSVAFELRYVQPPAGIASFNASLQPFDPDRLFKEIAEDVK